MKKNKLFSGIAACVMAFSMTACGDNVSGYQKMLEKSLKQDCQIYLAGADEVANQPAMLFIAVKENFLERETPTNAILEVAAKMDKDYKDGYKIIMTVLPEGIEGGITSENVNTVLTETFNIEKNTEIVQQCFYISGQDNVIISDPAMLLSENIAIGTASDVPPA